ncbi:MAG TPA: LysR family transcriptional regulator [Candidatus Aphodovivens excrementavium]|nr:LysR family transcriptional regulator [Candidatus Aphodovivens excrementavium]
MEIQQLRHLLAAAEHSSYAQAAKRCFTSRQNVAHSVKMIERELGVSLFERRGNEMVLTTEGKRVAKEASSIVAKVDNLRVMFSTAAGSSERLTFYVGTNILAGIPASVDAYIATHADKLQMIEASCEFSYKQVCSGEADIALIMCMERRFPECDSLEVSSSISYAITAADSPLAKLPSLTAANLKDMRLLLMSEPPFQYEPLFEQLDSLGFDRRAVSVIPSTSSMVHIMKSRKSVGIVSEKFSIDPPRGSIAVPIADTRLNWHFYILYQASSEKYPYIAKFAEGVRKAF